MTLGSLFDGSGGFPLAGAIHGIVPLWASEVEPYPIAVTRSRFPGMRHLGSVTEINGGAVEPVDVITFGSPCQDMSVAGQRAGMKHTSAGDEATTRSGLFYEAIRIIQEMREATNGRYPTFVVWENVPGAFTSNKGEDFRCVLEELARVKERNISVPRPANGKWAGAGEIVGDGFSIAWRVLDAQYWGIPQRRKRIYLVADFADGRAGKILFERDSLPGYPAAGGTAREGAAGDAEGGAAGSGQPGCMNPWDLHSLDALFPALNANSGGGQNVVVLDCRNLNGSSVSGTLQAKPNGGYSLNYQNPVVYDARRNGDGTNAPTLTGGHENRVTDYTCVVCMATGQANAEIANDMVPTLIAGHEHPIIAHDFRPTRQYIVRRLTPTECARLQGFPDDWGIPDRKEVMTEQEVVFWEGVRKTHAGMNGRAYRPCKNADALVKWYNKLHTDSSEYKMWGNGIALPCAAFVLGGVAEVMS